MDFVATCLSWRLVEKLSKFNVSTFNVNVDMNPSIIDASSDYAARLNVSVPLASVAEIDWVISRILNRNKQLSLTLMHGQHPMASGLDHVKIENITRCHVNFLLIDIGVMLVSSTTLRDKCHQLQSRLELNALVNI